ncbi:MAG: hypothetical protein WCX31_14125 [Salinivirgaceae bacterium]|jgi:hypothetical protein
MKLIFRKIEGEMEVLIRTGTAEDEFSYIEMVKSLIDNNKFEDTEFDVSITDKEKESINELLSKINVTVEENSKEKVE